jgi:hypothetical protein
VPAGPLQSAKTFRWFGAEAGSERLGNAIIKSREAFLYGFGCLRSTRHSEGGES